MTLEPGIRFGPYEILSPIGAGGMGEVYKARDTRLDRTVAVKVLPAELATDPERRSRFEREARAIAALTHPHICVIHDVGHQNGTDYLVMELLEGETLAERLASGSRLQASVGRSPKSGARSLSISETLRIATEIADALDKAHRAGIVHRDLKPANVMLTKSGVKLLDFGLAKLKGPAVPISMTAIEQATTTGGPKTASGTILGTIHYMAPEQVEGREADARADIWALGVVIYEMATGTRPFEGESAASIIGAILKDTPAPLRDRQPLAPAGLDHAVARCLARDPDDRWQTAADLRATLQWIASTGATSSAVASSTVKARPQPMLLTLIAGTLMFAAGLAAGWRYLTPASDPPPVVQFDVVPPIDAALSPAPVASAPQLAISPDGRLIAFVAAKRRGASQLYLRAVDGRDVRVLPDTDGASFPFWSADGRYIGFFAGRKLKKIAVSGGTSEILCDAAAGRGGTWNADGVILFSATPNTGLVRILASGGVASPVTSVHRGESGDVIGHNWPYFLPDGRHFLYYQRSSPETSGIYIGELDTSFRSARVLETSGMAVLANGYLAFVKDGRLLAQAFDERSFRVTGEPLRIADHVGYFSGTFGYSAIAASPANLLAYGGSVGTTSRLMWFGRDGKPGNGLGNPGIYLGPRLSPDQRTVIVAAAGETMADRDLWSLDVARNTATRVTSDPSADWFPAWAPDNRTIFFGSGRPGITSLYKRIGLGQEEPLTSRFPYAAYPGDVSSDGRLLAYTLSTTQAYDIGVMSLDTRKMTPFLATDFSEVQPRFAPNMKWLAYSSDESGQFEVYVRPYPSADKLWKISTTGGAQPEWRVDGKELFYVAANGKVMAVPVSINGEFQAGTAQPLFDVELPEANQPYPGHYAVTADGQRFLVNTVIDQPTRPALTAILNWTGLLKR